MLAQLEREVQALIQRAQQAENQATQEQLDIPAELRRARIARPCCRRLAKPVKKASRLSAAAEQAHYEAKRQTQRDAGKNVRPRGEAAERGARSESPIQFHRSEQRHHESGVRPAASDK